MSKVIPSQGDAVSSTKKPPKKVTKAVRLEMAKKAKALADSERLGTEKSLCSLTLADMGRYGIGIHLYFMLLKYLGILFVIMTILAAPAFILHSVGYGISPSIADPLGLSFLSLGNEGIHRDYVRPANCKPRGVIDCSKKTVSTPLTQDPYEVGFIISACDFFYSIAFLIFIKFFHYKMKIAIDENDSKYLTPKHYAVFVRGLPKDATEEEILDHFNSRYDLSKPPEQYPMWFGCFGKRKVKKIKKIDSESTRIYKPVMNTDHVNGNNIYLNKFVAHVSVAYSTGGVLRTFLSMEKLTAKIVQKERIYNLYKGETIFNPKMEKKLKQQLAKLNQKLENKTNNLKALKKAFQNKESKVKECECAYVVFNWPESRQRCLHDYRTSTGRIARTFQPKSLRFRQKHALTVIPAPEPSNIIWENLEITPIERFLRRSLTNLLTFLLLLISCALIYSAQSQQSVFASQIPPPNLCSETIPAVFWGSYGNRTDKELGLQYHSHYKCPKAGYHHVQYQGLLTVDTARTKSPINNTLNYEYCSSPCVSTNDTRICGSLPCFEASAISKVHKCESYKASQLLYCMCYPALVNSMKVHGMVQGAKNVWTNFPPCHSFLRSYSLKNLLLVFAALVVILVNLILKLILKGLGNFERHHSQSSRISSTVKKLFLAQLLNTAIIVLLLNANVSNIPIINQFSWIFTGEFQDFEREWYSIVGAGICTTMFINVVAPQMSPLLQTYVIFPLKRCFKRRYIITQEQMNELYEGPSFDISIRYPLLLNTLFVTMIYCGGIPVLIPAAAAYCLATYNLDKLTILRLYSIKTAYDESLGIMTLELLPWSLIFHLSFSMWMYGNPELIMSKNISINWMLQNSGVALNGVDPQVAYQELLSKLVAWDPLGEHGFIVKVIRVNVFPIFLLLVIYLSTIVFANIFNKVIYPILQRTVGKIATCIFGAAKSLKKKKPVVNEHDLLPAYTEPYEQIVSTDYNVDKSQGFELNGTCLSRKWVHDTVKYGNQRKSGERMLTWEAMSSHVQSYGIERNEHYKNAVQAFKTAEERIATQSIAKDVTKE